MAPLPNAQTPPAPGSTPRVRRILLATDLAPASAGAARQAIELAQNLGAELLIVSVIDPSVSGMRAGRVERMDQRRDAREATAHELVLLGRQVGVNSSFLVWEGEPGPAIVEAAAAEQVDMVVVGTRGRSRVERMVLGSVSDHVVRHAGCPVLIVRS